MFYNQETAAARYRMKKVERLEREIADFDNLSLEEQIEKIKKLNKREKEMAYYYKRRNERNKDVIDKLREGKTHD